MSSTHFYFSVGDDESDEVGSSRESISNLVGRLQHIMLLFFSFMLCCTAYKVV
jgi:hypothetical protein